MGMWIHKTYQVDHHVFVERGSPLCSYVAHVHDCLGVVCVNVEDGCIHHSRHISGVRRGARHTWIGGEANLTGGIKV